MRESDKYMRVVEWSEEDRCFVGRCPELMFGGVHGPNEQQVFVELCEVIEEWVATSKEKNEPLPPGLAGKKYSGKFNLRLGQPLHERLALESAKKGKSLNTYCVEALENAINDR